MQFFDKPKIKQIMGVKQNCITHNPIAQLQQISWV